MWGRPLACMRIYNRKVPLCDRKHVKCSEIRHWPYFMWFQCCQPGAVAKCVWISSLVQREEPACTMVISNSIQTLQWKFRKWVWEYAYCTKSLMQNATSDVFLLLCVLWRPVQSNYNWLFYVYQIYMHCVGSKSSRGEEKASACICTANTHTQAVL